MKRSLAIAAIASFALAAAADHHEGKPAGLAKGMGLYDAAELPWKDAPPSLPKGAMAAVLEGDPAKAGPFTMRFRFPSGYQIAPHFHSQIEHVTVLAGTLHFGMGETVPFEQLHPGAFINVNRTNGTGHAVVFLAFIDAAGREYEAWNQDVIGFTYFSAQGGADVGAGGLDFRYAVFSRHGSPPMPYRRDLNIIYSTNQRLLNTGEMWAPGRWSTP